MSRPDTVAFDRVGGDDHDLMGRYSEVQRSNMRTMIVTCENMRQKKS